MVYELSPWMVAARPKTLSATFAPALLMGALVFYQTGSVSIPLFFLCLFVALFIQLGTNLINDANDFLSGVDTKERLGPKRACLSGLLDPMDVKKGAYAFFFLAVFFSLPLIFYGGPSFFFLASLSALFGYLYTSGPYPLSYVALGDLFVFVFYGFVYPLSVYYLQTSFLDQRALLFSLGIALHATALIAINNLRDRKTDQKAGKNTLATLFGPSFALVEIAFCLLLPALLQVALAYQLGALFLLSLVSTFISLKALLSLFGNPSKEGFNKALELSSFALMSYALSNAFLLALAHGF